MRRSRGWTRSWRESCEAWMPLTRRTGSRRGRRRTTASGPCQTELRGGRGSGGEFRPTRPGSSAGASRRSVRDTRWGSSNPAACCSTTGDAHIAINGHFGHVDRVGSSGQQSMPLAMVTDAFAGNAWAGLAMRNRPSETPASMTIARRQRMAARMHTRTSSHDGRVGANVPERSGFAVCPYSMTARGIGSNLRDRIAPPKARFTTITGHRRSRCDARISPDTSWNRPVGLHQSSASLAAAFSGVPVR